ncbi:hypothetical protein [Methylotuvimicrobium sp. KM2]|uniref:hypothetical protein n=1 Tax=Methylotuvimicrobium sp. KM2 TaxID=3133976 RepID=UPI00310197A6
MSNISRLKFRYWTDACAVYNTLTGETHLFDNDYGWLLESFFKKRVSRLESIDMFAERFAFDSSAELEEALDLFLSECYRLFLLPSDENVAL